MQPDSQTLLLAHQASTMMRDKISGLLVAAGKKFGMGEGETFFIIYFYTMMCHIILPNNS